MESKREKSEPNLLDDKHSVSSTTSMLQMMTSESPQAPQRALVSAVDISHSQQNPNHINGQFYSQRQLKKPDFTLAVNELPQGKAYGLSKVYPITGLVLSGGGAKGVAYAGMVQALYEIGTLGHITHVCGASAGAMSASLIALGMNAEDFVQIVKNLNLSNLLRDKIIGRSSGERFTNILELLYFVQIKKIILESDKRPSDVPPGLQRKITAYTNLLITAELKFDSKLKNMKTIDDVLELTQDLDSLTALDNAFKTLRDVTHSADGTPYQYSFCFKDLTELRNFLPDNQKNRLKYLFIPVTNLSTQQPETYSEEHNFHESLALKVQTSGSHPLLFQSRLDSHTGHYLSDGGIYDNMPDSLLLKYMKPSQILCVSVEDADTLNSQLEDIHDVGPKKNPAFTYFERKITGLQDYGSAVKSLRERQSEYRYHDQMLILNSGSIKATTTQLNENERDRVIAQAKLLTSQYILHTWGSENIVHHKHPMLVMVQLTENCLKEIAADNRYDDREKQSAQLALIIIRYQIDCSMNLINCQSLLDQKDYTNCEDWFNTHVRDKLLLIQEILQEDVLENELDAERNLTMQLCKRQINYMSYGALEKFEKLYAKKQVVEEEKAVCLNPI